MGRTFACAGIAFIALAGSALACINDKELPAHEREFRSHYLGPVSPPRLPLSSRVSSDTLTGAGLALLTVGSVLAFTRIRARD